MLSRRYSTAVICALFIITAVSGQDKTKVVGDTVSFRPTNINQVTSLIWKHRSSNGIVVKAIEWDEDGFDIPNQRFKGITTLDEKTGQITITKLTVEHSGLYTIDLNSKEQEQRFNLKVLDRVPKPVIHIEKSSNPDAVYLRCGYSEMIIWKNATGQILIGSKDQQTGEFILVKNTRNPGNFYTCTLKNAVSEKTSDPVSEEDLFGTESNAGLVAGIVIGFLILVIVIFVLCYLFLETFHNGVNKICSCIPSFFGPLDCMIKKTEEVAKDSTPNEAAVPLNVPVTANDTSVDR